MSVLENKKNCENLEFIYGKNYLVIALFFRDHYFDSLSKLGNHVNYVLLNAKLAC